jgi:eukaryotic-like serine/threonine-protein kinase
MEGRAKVTKEVLCEEARFILANVMAEARYGRQNRYDDIRRVCEGAVSIPFAEYVGFLDSNGYLRHDRSAENLEVTPDGEAVVNGSNLSEFTEHAVSHFKKLRQSRASAAGGIPMGTQVGMPGQALPPALRADVVGGSSASRDSAGQLGSRKEKLSSNMRAAGDVGGDADHRYEKLSAIGSGGIGTVFRARQASLQREVALKEIRELYGFFSEEQRPEITRRFSDVVRAAAGLAHPNILPVHDINIDREFPNVVSELAPNGSCRRLISDAEELPVELVLKYLLQTLHALRAAHAQRVYHRGLKPEQLLIDGYGNIKVSDFGFTRLVERDQAAIRQVYVGLGNVAYMAPELYTEPMMSGPQGDVYALGIIFYELLTRKLPGRRSPMPSQVNPALPKGIDDIFDRMTRDGRNERYATIDDILADLDRLEGIENLLEANQIMVGEGPLALVKFKSGALEDPTQGSPVDGSDEDPSRGVAHRPYSFQQRRNSSSKKP